MKRYILICLIMSICHVQTEAQQFRAIKGKIYDAITKEPIAGALIYASPTNQTISKENGSFSLSFNGTSIAIEAKGYDARRNIQVNNEDNALEIFPTHNLLEQVVVTSNRTDEKRSEAPIAISTINKQILNETKAQRMDQLLNKVSGVFMASLGNEQHMMSIRQPMTTKSVFLYLEDGIPIRTTGVFNHNALLEMNLASAKSIEIIKGPSSAFYGGEAIAGAVNVITQSAPAYTSGSISTQMNGTGYKKTDLQIGSTLGKWGLLASGYYATRKDGPIEHSDFNKSAFSLRSDYKPNSSLTWTNTIAYVDYYSDMTGALDSIKYAQKNFSSLQSFTYRSVNALRIKSILSKTWNEKSSSSLSFLFRDNSVKQNPSYTIASTGSKTPTLFKGQLNNNSFKTNSILAQHTQKFDWLNSKLIAGASLDYSPQTYFAQFISITKDLSLNKYVSYSKPAKDSILSNYQTNIVNVATYIDYEITPLKNLKIVTAVRYDAFKYDFNNSLKAGASTGAPSSITTFERLTPKIGFTYNYQGLGIYGNYSEGYVPPQITELFNSVVVPYLQPQTFKNYEIGGWISISGSKLYADWSLYKLDGTNEIISVKLPDLSTANQNAGKTSHKGVEYGLNYRPNSEWLFRISGTNAKHTYVDNVVKGINYNGKEISGAPHFIANAELTYKPAAIKGLRISTEWQHQAKYFTDDLNNYTYPGFDICNVRVGYQLKKVELWVNALNILDNYYAVYATKSSTSKGSSSYAYNMGDPREITLGVAYRFGK